MTSSISILGSGWLGLALAKTLKKNNLDIKISTTSRHKLDGLKALSFDPFLINIATLNDQILTFLKSDILIINITSKDINAYQNIIQNIEKSPIKQVIFVSSTSVYKTENKVATETSPKSDSPLVKIEALFMENIRFKTTVIRFSGLIGPKRHPGKFFVDRLIPNPNGYVNMIHQIDAVNVIEHIINHSIWGEILNATAPSHPKRKDYYIKMKADLNLPVPCFKADENDFYKIVDGNKLINNFNFNYRFPDLMTIPIGAYN